MSSKHAAARGGRELTLLILKLLSKREEIPKELFENKKQQSRKLREMRRREYITPKNIPTRRGEHLLNEEKIWKLAIPQPKQWDGKWRMVLYDIPAKRARQRNAFRTRLKELGLELYQHSIWVYPYPLEKIVREISDFYRVSDCVLFAVAQELNREHILKQKFGLRS